MEKMVRNWSGQPGPEWTAFSLSMKGHARMRCSKLYDFDREKTVSYAFTAHRILVDRARGLSKISLADGRMGSREISLKIPSRK
jgi:hypothetical protein